MEVLPAVRVKMLYVKTPRPEPARYLKPPQVTGYENDLRVHTFFLPSVTKSKPRSQIQTQSSDFYLEHKAAATARDSGFTIQGKHSTVSAQQRLKPRIVIRSNLRTIPIRSISEKELMLPQAAITVKTLKRTRVRGKTTRKVKSPKTAVVTQESETAEMVGVVYHLQPDSPPSELLELRPSPSPRAASPMELPPDRKVVPKLPGNWAFVQENA